MTLATTVQARLDAKTKPRGSLGRLEALAVQDRDDCRRGEPGTGSKRRVVVAAGRPRRGRRRRERVTRRR